MGLSPGQVPEQPAVHRAADQLSPLGPGSGTGDLIQQPPVFCPGEIGVRQQARPGADGLGIALLLQPGAKLSRPAALPDNGVAHRLSRALFPEQRRLSLVGQTHRGDLTGADPALGHAVRRGPQLAVQQLHGVVLDPAWLWIVLRKGNLGGGDDLALRRKQQRPGAGGALVQGQQVVLGHGSSYFLAGSRVRAIKYPRHFSSV